MSNAVDGERTETKALPLWLKTQTQNLFRNRDSETYYGRWRIGGKQIWKSLKTDVFSVAKLRLADESAKIERLRGAGRAMTSGDCTMHDILEAYREQTNGRQDIKLSTKTAINGALRKILKTWPELARMKPLHVTPTAVAAWANRFKTDGTKFVPKGSRTVIKGNSASSVNKAVDVLRGVMDLAVERGAIAANTVPKRSKGERVKKKVERKRIDLPSTADFHRLLAAMENNGARGGWGREAADFCRFLAFTGCRVGEVSRVTWSCVDWAGRQVHLPGYKTETSDRYIPLFTDLEILLRSLIERRKSAARFAADGKPYLDPADSIFRIREAQKSIDAAATITGVKRVTHHDFRDMFATVCIESGVDIPTVARWLGHSDGGALLMKTYAHLRQEHSQAQAVKVSFGSSSIT